MNPKDSIDYIYTPPENETWGDEDSLTIANKSLKSICGYFSVEADISKTVDVRNQVGIQFLTRIQVPPQFHINVSWTRMHWGLREEVSSNRESFSSVQIETAAESLETVLAFNGTVRPDSAILQSHNASVKAKIAKEAFFRYHFKCTLIFQAHDSRFATKPQEFSV
jgi:hypothetical protein